MTSPLGRKLIIVHRTNDGAINTDFLPLFAQLSGLEQADALHSLITLLKLHRRKARGRAFAETTYGRRKNKELL